MDDGRAGREAELDLSKAYLNEAGEYLTAGKHLPSGFSVTKCKRIFHNRLFLIKILK
jgi:hypothetical protein